MSPPQKNVRVGVGVLVADPTIPTKYFVGSVKVHTGRGKLALPGGHLEMYESWEDCARREVLEECNLHIETPIFGHVTNDPMPNEHKHYVTIFMMAKCQVTDPVQIPTNMEPHKCEGWISYTWEELKQLQKGQGADGEEQDDGGKLFGPLNRLVQESPKAIIEFLTTTS